MGGGNSLVLGNIPLTGRVIYDGMTVLRKG